MPGWDMIRVHRQEKTKGRRLELHSLRERAWLSIKYSTVYSLTPICTPTQGVKPPRTKMSKRKRRNGNTLSDAQRKQIKKDQKRERRRINLTLSDKHTYTPPANLDINQIEMSDPTSLFTTVPCQICEVANCGQ